MRKSGGRLLLFLLLLIAVQEASGQVLRRDRDAGQLPPSDRNDEFNPFAEGIDSLDGEPSDTTRGDLIAQNTDTINFVKVVRRYDLNIEPTAPVLSLDSVHHYQPVNRTLEPSINLGNNGLPILRLTKQFNYSSSLNLGFDKHDLYQYQNNDIDYYRAQRPFTRLKYVTGTERENNFEFEHTQNWGRGLNVGVQYERLVSEGFYDNQDIDHRNFALHGWYQGKRKHFNSMAHFITNKYLNGANGGIVPFLQYYGNENFDQRRNIPVRLSQAERRMEGSGLHWQNSYDFGKNIPVKINDTISDTQIIPRFRVQHTFQIKSSLNNFTLPYLDSIYFDDVFVADTLLTTDSLDYRNLSNEFRIKWLGNKLGDSTTLVRQNFLADAFARFSTIDVEQRLGQTDSFTDLAVGGSFRSNPLDSPKIIYKAEGAYHLFDYRAGDYFARGEAGFDLNFTGSLVGFVEFTNQAQPFTANQFYQTHYQFNNDFDKLNTRVIGGNYKNQDLRLTATVRFANSGNILYYDAERQPQLSGDAVSYVLANVNKQFNLGRFYLDASGYYQTTSDDEAIRVPDIIGKGVVYYKGPLFQNNVIAKIGLNAFYANEYQLLGYDPALDQFFNQNRNPSYPNNAQVGFFSNFQLSRARVFLRLDNITAPIVDLPIMQGFAYPQHDFAFRAGINWVFVN